MWECSYSREPIDNKLTLLLLIKKIWIILATTVITAVVVGLGYYVLRVVITKAPRYRVETQYYIDYAGDSEGNEYVYFNHFTWGELVKTDYFVDSVYASMNKELSKEEITEYLGADIPSDTRVLYTYATTPDKELSKRVNEAFENAVLSFSNEQKEINEIREIKAPGEPWDISRTKPLRAALLGAILGFLGGIIGWLLKVSSDAGIYIPSSLERRYKKPCLGAPCMSEFSQNAKKLLEGAKKVALVFCDEEKAPEYFLSTISGALSETEFVEFYEICDKGENDKLRDCDKSVVIATAGVNSKTFERTLEFLNTQDITVTALALCSEDVKLINKYYKR